MDYFALFGMIIGALFWMFFVFGVFIILPAIYLLTNSPNRFLSSVFSYKIWGAGIFLVLLSIGLFLSDILAFAGLRSGSFDWNFTDIRYQLVMLIVSLYLLIVGLKFLPKSIFDTEKKDKKSPDLYVSHVFHLIATSILIALETGLIAVLANHLLKFGIRESWEEVTHNTEFFVNFVTILLPTIILGLFLLPSFHSQKRFLPQVKSEVISIFQMILLSIAGGVMLFTLTILFREGLVVILNSPELPERMNLNEIRETFIPFILSILAFVTIWTKCGGTNAYVKK